MASTSSIVTGGTVIDVPSLVSQLMSVERQPIDKLNSQVSSYQAKISSWGTLSGLVSSFQSSLAGMTNLNPSTLQSLTATASDTTVLSASADNTSVAGVYSLSVSSLAQAQNLVAAGQTSTTAAIGNGTATTVTFDFGTISGGTLTNGIYSGATFTSNGSGTKSITIDSTNNTLQGIRDTINAANLGVTATIVNDGSGTPYRLTITSNSTGLSNSLKITTSGGDGSINTLLGYDPAGTQNLTQTASAQNANLTVNGIAISQSSNTVTGAIQGVTMTLNKITSSPVTLTVAKDTGAITKALSSFVDAYNAMAGQFKSRSAYGTATATAGVLAGDGTIRMLQSQLRGIFNTPPGSGTLTSLAQIGISFQTDGTLKLDSSKLSSMLSSNFSGISTMLSSSTGFATRLDAWASSALAPGTGVIAAHVSSLNSYVTNFNDQISRLELRMTALQKQYTTTYSNLDMMLASMNSTSSYLSQQLTK